MRRAFMRAGRRWLYISHRWIGIVTCLLFAMWFMSGVVMMYVPFPSLTDKERMAALPDIAWSRVVLPPDAALAAAGATRFPRDLRLSLLADEPVYRLTGWDGRHQVLSAVDGRVISGITGQQALAVARHHPASQAPQLLQMVDRDQWSVTARYDPLRPFYLIALGDGVGTELYVSSRSGEIALDTTRSERLWNWLGSIPHWIYPTALRKDGPSWRLVVLWVSGVALIGAVTGVWIGVLRVRLRRRSAGTRITPYRGWMAWHHVTGLIAGPFVLTWIFSGWLSLDPGGYFADRTIAPETMQRYAGHDAPDVAAALPPGLPADVVEARFVWRGGRALMIIRTRDGTPRLIAPGSGEPFQLTPDQLRSAAAKLLPDAHLVELELLRGDDAYWYAHHGERELPVLRARFDDASQTWFHVSPVTGDLLGRLDARGRVYRWLFNALHSLDVQPLLRYRPAWDIVMVLLSIAGSVVSVSGVVVGWRYLRRH